MGVNIFTYIYRTCQYIDMEWRKELGEQIKAERRRAGLSQEALADRLSVTRVQLGNYEKGKSAIPVNILTEIARALQVKTFLVNGYKVIPQDSSLKLIHPLQEQLSLAFDQEHQFGSASVNIVSKESAGSIVITAVFKKPRVATR